MITDSDIIAHARSVESSGNYTAAQQLAKDFLRQTQEAWSAHAAQDARYMAYCARPWWQRLFRRRPYGGPLPGRFQAADNLAFAKAFSCAAAQKDLRRFRGNAWQR